MSPVFLHSLWRSASTYVWSRFRTLDGVVAYYEPFHEMLGVAGPDELAAQSPDGWAGHHPKLDRGYYAEYLPLVAGRGVPGFQKAFTVDHYFEEDEVLATERPYIDLLLNHAQGRVAVLACCRTIARAPWLRRQYDGTHIVVTRDPAQQWYSGYLRKIEAGHAYFEVMPFHILGKAKWEPARRIARLFGIPCHEASSFFLEHEFYFSQFAGAEFERSYAAFYSLLHLSLQRAITAADIIIDIDRLSADEVYRRDATDRIYAATGLPVSFDDAAVARHQLPRPAEDFKRIELSVKALIANSTGSGKVRVGGR